jgi:tRNA(Ile)-lysidine synthase
VEVVCAVSGGPDSTALLLLAVAAECAVSVVHVDHGLRESAAAESVQVAGLCGALGVGFRAERVEVRPGPNLEARAREARRAVLPAAHATGHTADDRAETVLINLLRGAGVAGLSPLRAGPAHPIVGLRRVETAALCAAAGLTPLEDPMNRDRRFLRVRVRHEVLPLLSDVAGRDVVPLLCRQADVLGEVATLLTDLAGALDPGDARAVAAAPAPVAALAVRALLGGEHPPDRATVRRVLAVARGEAVGAEVGEGRQVRRSRQRLRVVEPSRSQPPGGAGEPRR